eukprot:4973969-Pyramimonas_sp.AAC.1
MSGRNCERFRKLGGLLTSIRMPWVCIGDYNMSPETLAKSKFLERVGGAIIRTADVTGTCAKKNGEDSMLDYLVMSPSAVPFVKEVNPIRDVAWRPHIGLAITLRASGQQLQTREL